MGAHQWTSLLSALDIVPALLDHRNMLSNIMFCGVLQMLDVTLPFDEVAVLEQNAEYLQRAGNLAGAPLIVHKVAAGADAVPGPGAQPLPGKPAPRIETRPVTQ